MSIWRRWTGTLGGLRAIGGLGIVFLVFGAAKVALEASTGSPLAEVLTEAFFFGTPVVVLGYGVYWIRRSDLHPDQHPRIAAWCFGGLAVMLGAHGLLVVNTDATFVDPIRAGAIDAGVGALAGLGVGVMEARALERAKAARSRERALRERNTELETLIELLPVAVFVAEADGEIIKWNEAAEAIWGGEIAASDSIAEYSRYDAWWVETGEPVDPEEWPLARALDGEAVTDPDEIRIKGFDGEFRTVLNHGMPIRDADGEVTRAVVTLTDITELEESQRKLERSNERLEQFAFAASHDLQEPIRMVSSYLQLLENRYADDLDEEGREYVEFAVDGAERMREMIQALLEYSRVDRTDADSFEFVDLDAVLDDVLDDLRVRIAETNASITAESLPEVYGNEEQLRQVLSNLLDNAIEYRGDEPPRIDISVERDGDECVVAVEDSGVGIDVDETDRVFDVFERLHPPDRHEGTGIGLALCQRIVERHGGDIRVDSEPGEGATFSFTLPVEERSPGGIGETTGASRERSSTASMTPDGW